MGTELSDEMSDADLVNLLRRVSSDLEFRQWVKNRGKVILGLLVVLGLTTTISVISLVFVRRFQYEACDRDNRLRAAYVDQWTPLLAETPAPTPPPPESPQEVLDAYNDQVRARTIFVEGLTNGFAQHGC